MSDQSQPITPKMEFVSLYVHLPRITQMGELESCKITVQRMLQWVLAQGNSILFQSPLQVIDHGFQMDKGAHLVEVNFVAAIIPDGKGEMRRVPPPQAKEPTPEAPQVQEPEVPATSKAPSPKFKKPLRSYKGGS